MNSLEGEVFICRQTDYKGPIINKWSYRFPSKKKKKSTDEDEHHHCESVHRVKSVFRIMWFSFSLLAAPEKIRSQLVEPVSEAEPSFKTWNFFEVRRWRLSY